MPAGITITIMTMSEATCTDTGHSPSPCGRGLGGGGDANRGLWSARPPPPNPLPQGEGEYQLQHSVQTPHQHRSSHPAHCSVCSPGCRRHFRPAPTPIRTAWNGRSERGDITDGDTLRAWLADVLIHGSGRNDAILLRHAHRARGDHARLNELAAAIAPSRERRMETLDQGTAFVAAAAAWHPPELPERVAYPVAVGAMAGRHGIDEDTTDRRLPANLHHQPDLRRGAPGAARPEHGPARARRAGADHPARSRRQRAPPRSTISAAARSVPTSPPCATKPSTRGCSAHESLPARPAARRHRRSGRHRQDRADGRAVQASSRRLRHRRDHQRHLHQGRRGVPDPRRARCRRSASWASRPAAARTPRSARTHRSTSPASPN